MVGLEIINYFFPGGGVHRIQVRGLWDRIFTGLVTLMPKPGDNNTNFSINFRKKIQEVPYLYHCYYYYYYYYYYFVPFLFLDFCLDFKNQGKSAGNVTKYYSSFALRKSKCSGRYSSSFSSPKQLRELYISESGRSSRRPKVAEVLVVQPKSSDSVHALTSHEQGQLSTKTNKTCTDVHIGNMQLK